MSLFFVICVICVICGRVIGQNLICGNCGFFDHRFKLNLIYIFIFQGVSILFGGIFIYLLVFYPPTNTANNTNKILRLK